MPTRAWLAAQELDAQCQRCGLDTYMQAGILMMAAEGTAEEDLWFQVWRYVEITECIACDERFLVVLERDLDAGA